LSNGRKKNQKLRWIRTEKSKGGKSKEREKNSEKTDLL
jgi:hypothetical protein